MLNVRILIATISLVSMVFQPVAYGQAQENWAAQALKQFVQQNQKAGKPLTVKQYWDKNKAVMDPEWQKKFFPAVNIQKDERLPQMEVIRIKGANGQESARLVMTLANKKTISIEMMGGQEKYARINNQIISYNDFYYGDGLVEKLIEDSVVKAESQKIKKMALNSSIVPSYELFVKMTPRERAEYFLNLRMVLQAAEEVTNRAVEASNKNTEAASWIDLLIEKAYALENSSKKWIGQRCIIAGYVGNYTQDTEGSRKGDIYCSSTKAVSNFAGMNALNGLTQNKTSPTVYAGGSCGSGSLPCQPFLFQGLSGPACFKINRQESSTKQATRSCDGASPLRADSLAKDTEAFIKQRLKVEEKEGASYFKDGKVISQEKYDELMNTVVQDFNLFINDAIGTCRDSKNLDGTTNFGEKYQGDACAILKERKLAFAKGFESLKGQYENPIPTPAPIVQQPPIAEEGQCKTASGKPGFYDHKCACLEPGTGEAGIPGKPKVENGKCIAITPVPLPVATADTSKCGPQMAPAPDKDGQIKCYPIAASREVAVEKRKKDSGFDCSIICPLAVGALFLYGAYALTKSGQKNKPGKYVPPAPGPLPVPPPQPTPYTPPPPIAVIPSLPEPTPIASETPSTATPGQPANGGVR